jgi:hypothetical protein
MKKTSQIINKTAHLQYLNGKTQTKLMEMEIIAGGNFTHLFSNHSTVSMFIMTWD